MKVTQFYCQKKLVVPIDFISYCSKNKLIEELQLFLFLKISSSGKIKNYKSSEQEIMSFLQIRKKDTLRARFKKLEKLYWLGYDNFNDVVHLRSLPDLHIKLKLKSLKSTFLEMEHFQIFSSWVVAALIGEAIQRQRGKRLLEDRLNRLRSKQRRTSSPAFHLGLSNGSIAKLLNVSKAQAGKLKIKAGAVGLLAISKRYKEVVFNGNKHTYFNKTDLLYFKAAYPDLSNKAKLIQGKIVLQTYDEIEPVLRFKKRRYLLKPPRINHLPNYETIINSGSGSSSLDKH